MRGIVENQISKPLKCSEYSASRGLTGGACVNTLYSWPNHSSSSRIEATFPHLSHCIIQYPLYLGVGIVGIRRGYRNWGIVAIGGSKSDERGAPITIIRGTPDGDNRSIEHHFVAFHGQLMRSGNQIYGIIVDELFGDVCAEKISGTPGRNAPSFDV